MQIYRQAGRYSGGRLLYAPEHSVKWPQWSDVDRRHRRSDTRRLWEIKMGLKDAPNGLSGMWLARNWPVDDEM
jgi:ribosomal protein L20